MGMWSRGVGLVVLGFVLLVVPASGAFGEEGGQQEDPEGLDLSEEERLERARAAFARGRAAYIEARYAEAIGHWETANSILPNPRLYLFIGQAWANQDNYREAIRFYRRFAQSSSEAEAEIREELAELVAQARRRSVFEASLGVESGVARALGSQPPPRSMRRYELGTTMRDVPVQIRSVPSGATVYIDDATLGPVGVTPLDTRLFTGNHLIIVEREHHVTQRRVVPVTVPRSGESIPLVRFDLEREQVPVRVSVDPITAGVTFVGEAGVRRDLGVGGWEGMLPAGSGTFIIQQGGTDRREEQVLSPPEDGDVLEMTLHLDPSRAGRSALALGTLRVRAESIDGEVFINNRRMGRSPGEFEERLAPGSHVVSVRLDGHQTWSQTVRVSADESQTLVTPQRLERLRLAPTWPGWVMTGLGVGAAGAGAGLFLTADEDASERDLGLYGMIGGGALVAGGVVWLAVAGASRARAREQADGREGVRFLAVPVVGGGAVLLQGGF
ncbi:MAG: PEGA domain-containing protein [Deltaproteobacteria bacterium]|nr:MAG: PEGA domain-containing protein [Deltaproteobacteria bacterium]